MREQVIVWDLETIPDLEAFAAASNLQGKPESEVRDGMGDKFPKLVSHKIACIGALVVSRSTAGWQVDALGAPHIGERSEKDLIPALLEDDDSRVRLMAADKILERKGRDRGYGSKLAHEDVTPMDPELETKRREVLGAFMAFLSEKARGLHRDMPGMFDITQALPRKKLDGNGSGR